MILVTGGAGFIGSHTIVELCNLGYEPIIFDNFANSNPAVLGQINRITGKNVPFVCGDIRVKEQYCEYHKINNKKRHKLGLFTYC